MSYLRIYKNNHFQLTYQSYDSLNKAMRDKMVMGGHVIKELGPVDNA